MSFLDNYLSESGNPDYDENLNVIPVKNTGTHYSYKRKK